MIANEQFCFFSREEYENLITNYAKITKAITEMGTSFNKAVAALMEMSEAFQKILKLENANEITTES